MNEIERKIEALTKDFPSPKSFMYFLIVWSILGILCLGLAFYIIISLIF